MVRQRIRPLTLAVLALACAGAAALIVGRISASSPRPPSVRSAGSSDPAGYGPPALALYEERAPHVDSLLNVYALQGGVRGAGATPASTLPPVPAAAFAAPIASYRAYAESQLTALEGQVTRLRAALAAGDRITARAAWRASFADYLRLGAVYLQGPLAGLNQAVDGTPGGLVGGASSPRFSGLHRLELGLWTDQPLSGLRPWAQRLAADAGRLRGALRSVAIAPKDYATRAHEILEDASRDLVSGADVPWSGEGVLGARAGLAATTEVVGTLAQLLRSREGVLLVVQSDLRSLRSTFAAIQRAHAGRIPTDGQLTRMQSERLDASLGQALEGLAQIPGALETKPPAVMPAIPASAVRIDG